MTNVFYDKSLSENVIMKKVVLKKFAVPDPGWLVRSHQRRKMPNWQFDDKNSTINPTTILPRIVGLGSSSDSSVAPSLKNLDCVIFAYSKDRSGTLETFFSKSLVPPLQPKQFVQ